MRIAAHEDSWCPKCKTATIGPTCHWCAGAETVRYSPEETTRRCSAYRRFRAAGCSHADALLLLDQVAELVNCDRRTNTRVVRELVAAGAEPAAAIERVRPLRTPTYVAVAA